MKHFKVFVMATALTLGSLGAATASNYKYDPGMSRAAIAQHENVVRELQRQAAHQQKYNKSEALKAQASANETGDVTPAAGLLGFLTVVAIIAAL